MINNKTVISIIPARSGSKGLPGKNLKELNGIPLITWSIHQALLSRHVDLVLVSTDCPEIASVALNAGAEVPFIRPQHLATDDASTYDVIEHCISCLEARNESFDYVALIEPTSPLRKESDIDNMIAYLDSNSNHYDSLVSLGEVPTHPHILKEVDNHYVTDFIESPMKNRRRQEYDPVFFPYGVGYIAKTSTLLTEKTFYTRRCMSYFIDRWQCYEIDDICDFICVQAILSSGYFL